MGFFLAMHAVYISPVLSNHWIVSLLFSSLLPLSYFRFFILFSYIYAYRFVLPVYQTRTDSCTLTFLTRNNSKTPKNFNEKFRPEEDLASKNILKVLCME